MRSPWFVFCLVAVAQFMVVLDVCITNVALPAIGESLHFAPQLLQWVVTAYALTFGGFLLLGGRAADIFGHRRVLLVGLIGFSIISLFIGLSISPAMLIGLRALQGISAALMSPSALSIVLMIFAEGKERNRALGHWTTVSTGGAAVGLLLGGILTQFLSWRWNFFVNVPIGFVLSLMIARLLPHEPQEHEHHTLDVPGALLITSGLMLLVFALSQAPVWGWTSFMTVASLILSVVLFCAFLWNEARSTHPLVPLSIFRSRNLSGANLMGAPITAGAFGMFFLISLYVQKTLQFSPLMTGLCFLPFPIILGSLSQRMARGVTRYGFKPFLIIGPLIVSVSILWLVRLPVHGNYWTDILPNVLLMPVGMAMTFMPLMVAATSGVSERYTGLASGLINTSQQMGGALGLAVLSSIAVSVTTQRMTVVDPLTASVDGYHMAFACATLFIILAIIVAIVVIRSSTAKHVGNHQAHSL